MNQREGFAGTPEKFQATAGSFREHKGLASGRYLRVLYLMDDPMSKSVVGLLRGLRREEGHDVLDLLEVRALLDNGSHLLVIRID